MKVELFYTSGCEKCADARKDLKAAAKGLVPRIIWRELNLLDELDYAVELGVLTVPAIAMDGELVFPSLPTPRQFRRELEKRVARGPQHGR